MQRSGTGQSHHNMIRSRNWMHVSWSQVQHTFHCTIIMWRRATEKVERTAVHRSSQFWTKEYSSGSIWLFIPWSFLLLSSPYNFVLNYSATLFSRTYSESLVCLSLRTETLLRLASRHNTYILLLRGVVSVVGECLQSNPSQHQLRFSATEKLWKMERYAKDRRAWLQLWSWKITGTWKRDAVAKWTLHFDVESSSIVISNL